MPDTTLKAMTHEGLPAIRIVSPRGDTEKGRTLPMTEIYRMSPEAAVRLGMDLIREAGGE